MPRQSRVIIPNSPHHILQRGHNRQAIFVSSDDFKMEFGDKPENLDTRAQEYLPQLLCYREAVTRAQTTKPVLGLFINWISAGRVSVWSPNIETKE